MDIYHNGVCRFCTKGERAQARAPGEIKMDTLVCVRVSNQELIRKKENCTTVIL